MVLGGLLVLVASSCMPGAVKVELSAPAPGMGWPQPRLNDANTAFVEQPVALPEELLWEAKTDGNVLAELTADRGLVVASSQSNRMFFFDVATGQRLHREEFAGPPTTGVFIGDSLAFAVDAKKPRFYLWELVHQKPGHELPVTRMVAPPARLPRGWLLQTYDGLLAMIDTVGDTAWTHQAAMPLLADVAYANERIYVVSGGKRVVCLDAADGSTVWEHSSAGAHAGSPAIDELLYFGSLDSNFYALDCETGAMRWFFHTDGQIFTSPAVDRQQVYFGANDGFFYALNKYSGELAWRLSAGLVHNSSPVVWDSVVIFGSSDGRLLVVHAEDGRVLREFRTRGGIYGAPVVYQDRVLVADTRRRLYCFGPVADPD